MNRIVKTLSRVAFAALFVAETAIATQEVSAQALTMDGQSGIFFQPWANVAPSSPGKFNGPTLSYHAVTAGPVAGDYFNVSVEEGFGSWLEFGYTRDNHTDGGNPALSPLFNDAGMNIFNIKAKVLPENFHKQKWIPAVAVGGALRTNDPYVSQASAQTNATNGDIYGVATKLVVIEKKFPLLLSGGARGTNAEVYGYGGNATNWQARAFGALAIPIPVRHAVFAPTVEIDQEPHHLKYVAYANIPTTEVYAVRISDYPNQKWAIDIGTGHVASTAYPGIALKANNALAIAFDRRF
ncbi:MAG: DUF3034 family protein [Edaphobacter sp.]|jgi:hypothetical protein